MKFAMAPPIRVRPDGDEGGGVRSVISVTRLMMTRGLECAFQAEHVAIRLTCWSSRRGGPCSCGRPELRGNARAIRRTASSTSDSSWYVNPLCRSNCSRLGAHDCRSGDEYVW